MRHRAVSGGYRELLPIGADIRLVFTLKLGEISQRMDNAQSTSRKRPRSVVFLLVFFAVFRTIQHSFDLMAAITKVCDLTIDRVEGLFGAAARWTYDGGIIAGDDDQHCSLLVISRSRPGSSCASHTSWRSSRLLGASDTALRHGGFLPIPQAFLRIHLDAPNRAQAQKLRGRMHGPHHLILLAKPP